ncbi:hypothetical protein D3C71_1294450 [compost metagenome]
MAIIPLKQTVIHEKLSGTDPDYGDPIYSAPITLSCRFQEGAKLVRNQRGEEVVSMGAFYFDKLANIGFNDTLTHTNELGAVTTYTPIAISVKRAINGKPILTEVSV